MAPWIRFYRDPEQHPSALEAGFTGVHPGQPDLEPFARESLTRKDIAFFWVAAGPSS